MVIVALEYIDQFCRIRNKIPQCKSKYIHIIVLRFSWFSSHFKFLLLSFLLILVAVRLDIFKTV